LLEKVTRGTLTTYKHYIEGSTGMVAEYTRASDNTTATYYMTKDHLGSVDGVISSAGAVLAKYSFDPFGQRRNPTGWTGLWTNAEATTAQNSTR
jgi:hypothetical protein